MVTAKRKGFILPFPIRILCCTLKTPLKIQENIPLAPLTTLQVGGPARYFAHARSESDVVDALAYAADRRLPLFVLGGGSNLVVSDAGWPGLILQIALMGCNCWNADRSRVFAA